VAEDQGQMPEDSNPSAGTNPAPVANEAQTYSADYVKTLREEAKESRLQNKKLSTELESLKVAVGDNSALKAKIDEMTSNLAKAQAEAESASKRADLVRLAAKAGVPVDVAELIDLSKIDLKDEAKALEKLGKLAAPASKANPARPGTFMNTGLTDSELRQEIYGGRANSIFGGSR
jgi:hypothetical protein